MKISEAMEVFVMDISENGCVKCNFDSVNAESGIVTFKKETSDPISFIDGELPSFSNGFLVFESEEAAKNCAEGIAAVFAGFDFDMVDVSSEPKVKECVKAILNLAKPVCNIPADKCKTKRQNNRSKFQDLKVQEPVYISNLAGDDILDWHVTEIDEENKTVKVGNGSEELVINFPNERYILVGDKFIVANEPDYKTFEPWMNENFKKNFKKNSKKSEDPAKTILKTMIEFMVELYRTTPIQI